MAKKTTDEKPKKKPAVGNAADDAEHKALAAELRGLIPQLDSEGLAFLVEQARVHLYNMKVDELNRAALTEDDSPAKKTRPAAKPEDGAITIIGSESGSSFYLRYRNDDAMFSREEMAELVRIVNGPGTDLEIRGRLLAWLDRERKDVFSVLPVKDKFDDRLKKLAAVIKKNFKLRREN